MVVGRREGLRQHALDIASCQGADQRTDWDHFRRTGQFVKPRPFHLDREDEAALQAEIARITADGGKFIMKS